MTSVGSGVKLEFPYVNPYNHTIPNQGPDWDHVIHYDMTQLSMKVGMEIFGTRGVYAVSKEPKNMHLRSPF